MMLSLAEVGVKPIVQGPVTLWLSEEDARLIGFSDAEIAAAKADTSWKTKQGIEP